jgi:hypothetical protein
MTYLSVSDDRVLDSLGPQNPRNDTEGLHFVIRR